MEEEEEDGDVEICLQSEPVIIVGCSLATSAGGKEAKSGIGD